MEKAYFERKSVKPLKILMYVLTISTLCLFAKYPFDGAEDVINARRNFMSKDRSDFWGAFSAWFYSFSDAQHWEIFYAVLFITMIAFGVYQFYVVNSRIFHNRILLLCSHFVAYFSMLFSLSFSRDGALLSFFWLAFGIWVVGYKRNKRAFTRILFFLSSIFSLAIGFAFRPWLSISASFLLLALARLYPLPISANRRIISFFMFGFMLSAPIAIELSAHRTLTISPAYPQQQVMIMDASSLACLMPVKDQFGSALNTINDLASDKPLSRAALCGQYFPQNWGSVAYYGSLPGEVGAVELIRPRDEKRYAKFRGDWFNLISTNLTSYIQVKLFLGSQFLLAGESPTLAVRDFRSFLEFPFNAAKFLRLFSGLPIIMLLIFYQCRRFTSKNSLLLFETLFYLSYITTSIIAFIGDNQRYIVFGALVVSLLLIQNSVRFENEKRE